MSMKPLRGTYKKRRLVRQPFNDIILFFSYQVAFLVFFCLEDAHVQLVEVGDGVLRVEVLGSSKDAIAQDLVRLRYPKESSSDAPALVALERHPQRLQQTRPA